MDKDKKKWFPGSAWNITDEKARKELKWFLIAGWLCGTLALFDSFGFLSVVPAGAGLRCIILSFRKGNAEAKYGNLLIAASIAMTLLGVFEFLVYERLIG